MTDTVSTEAGKTVEQFDGKIENAYGRPLNKNKFKEGKEVVAVLAYSASYEKLESYDDIPSDEMPSKDDVLATVNAARKANARQKAMQKALDNAGVIKPTMEDDAELQIAAVVKGLVASGKYKAEEAREIAKNMLGIS